MKRIPRLAVVIGVWSLALGIPLLGSAQAAAPIGAYTRKGAWSYVSAPNLHPPQLATDASVRSKSLASGDFLVDNFPNVTVKGPMTGEGGPLILNNQLQPVWSYPVGTGVVSTDLQQETYQGKPVLLWWQGVVTATGASTSGEVVVVDQHYRKVATIKAAAPWVVSLHDAVISGNNIWVTAYQNVPNQDLSAYGGSATGVVYDAGVQEYDLKTGQLVHTWDALNPGGTPNIPLSQSQQPAPAPTSPAGTAWDAYHINSIQLLRGNQMLVSMRNTWAAYLINTTTNQTVWTLGGKASNFALPANAQFAWQHDVQMHSNGEVTLFDDNCCKIIGPEKFANPNGQAEGLVLKLNTSEHTASRVAVYPHSPKLDVSFLGSLQLLSKGNALVGWGSRPLFSEYSKSGKLLLDAVWPGKDLSYRALFTNNWVGTPYFPPSLAVRTAHGNTTVYASWDGATKVASWKVLAGTSASHLTGVATQAKNGFETAIGLSTSYKAYKVQALDSKGHVLRTSAIFPPPKSKPPGFY